MIPHMRRPPQTVHPTPDRITSMCLEIADFTHADCPGGWCTCPCGHPGAREEAAS